MAGPTTLKRIRRIPTDLSTIGRATVVLFWTARLVRRHGRAETLRRLGDRAPEPPYGRRQETWVLARRTGQLVNGVGNRLPLDLHCLPKSITTWYLLRRRGIATDMPVGVRRGSDGDLAFHTWVEYCGHPVNDRSTIRREHQIFGDDTPVTAEWV